MKYLFLILGTISLGLGFLGIAIPGLPTTPFLLLSTALFFRSSKHLYNWLISHKLFGKFISDYREKKAIPLSAKISAVVTMLIMISISTIFLIPNMYLKIAVILLGGIGLFIMLRIPTLKK